VTVPLILDTVNHQVTYTVPGQAPVVVLSLSDFPNGISDSDLFANAIDKVGTHRFRYLLPTGDYFGVGTLTITVTADAVKNADVTDSTTGTTTPGTGNLATTITATIEGPTATLSDPGDNGTIDINVLNNRNWIDVTFNEPLASDGARISPKSITDL